MGAIGVVGDVSVDETSLNGGRPLILPLLSEEPELAIYAGIEIRREDYSHLHVNRSVASIAYVPLVREDQLVGALEIFVFSDVLDPDQLEEIAPIIQLAVPAILAAEDVEQSRQNLLDSLHRISQFYDLEKSLNATLELSAVTASIPVKAMAMLPCQAIHLWMFEGDALRLMGSHGEDATVEKGMTQAPGQGYVADMAEEGERLLIDDRRS